MSTIKTVRVQHADPESYPEGLDINESDYDPKVHTLLEPVAQVDKAIGKDPSRMNKTELQAHLTSLGIGFDEDDTKADLLARLPK